MDNEGCSGEHNHGGPQESSIEERTNVNKGEGVLKKNSKENLQARSKEVSTPSIVQYLILTLIIG